jgi:5-methylcytosine-specific restriction endonuclease McrA
MTRIPEPLRRRVIEKASAVTLFECPFCHFVFIHGVDDPNINVDHITPQSAGGLNVESNLQVTCRSCNKSKRTSAAPISNRKNVSRLVLCSCGKRISLTDFDYHVNIDLVRTNAILCNVCLNGEPSPLILGTPEGLPSGFEPAKKTFKKLGIIP